VAQEIENAYPDIEVIGNPNGSSRLSSFEVTDEAGNLYYSKLQTKSFPSPGSVVKALKDKGF